MVRHTRAPSAKRGRQAKEEAATGLTVGHIEFVLRIVGSLLFGSLIAWVLVEGTAIPGQARIPLWLAASGLTWWVTHSVK